MASPGYALTVGADAASAVNRDAFVVVRRARAGLASPGRAQPLTTAGGGASGAHGAGSVDGGIGLGGSNIGAAIQAHIASTVHWYIQSTIEHTSTRASTNGPIGQANTRTAAPIVEEDGLPR